MENSQPPKKRRLLLVVLLPIFAIVCIIAVSYLLLAYRNHLVADREYEALRQHSPFITATPQPSIEINTDEPESISMEVLPMEALSESAQNLLAINSDYVGWIRIGGTNIDYPIVRADNNFKYLFTTFTGEENEAGSIFMDYRVFGLDAPFVIIYGHNMLDGSMFAALENFMNTNFLAENSALYISTLNDEMLKYKIFDAIVVYVSDYIFTLIGKDNFAVMDYLASIGAPHHSDQLLVLSTCIGSNDDERLLILAVPDFS